MRTVIELIRKRKPTFYGRSDEFLDDMLVRCRTYSAVFISKKQFEWLCSLAAQAGVTAEEIHAATSR